MKRHKKLLLFAGIGLLLSGTQLFGAEKSAAEILKNSYRYIGGLDQFTFDALITESDTKEGKVKQHVSVAIDRPGKMRVITKGDIKNRAVYLDDGTFTMMDNKFNYYGQLKTPKTIDATLDMIFDKYGIKAPLASLLYTDMDKRMKFKGSRYFGTKEVGGVMCDYVAFKTKLGTIHIWITTGDKPLVKTYTIVNNTPQQELKRDTTIRWNTDPKLSASDFIFKAPKGASKISIEPAN